RYARHGLRLRVRSRRQPRAVDRLLHRRRGPPAHRPVLARAGAGRRVRARHAQPGPVREVDAARGAPPVRRLDAAHREPLRRGHQPVARALVPPGVGGARADRRRRVSRRDRHPALLGARAGRDAAARALEPRGPLRRPRRHAVLARRAPAGAGGAQVTSNPDKESVPMATDRPLVVLAGPIHPAGRANLDTEARVVVCDDETEAGFLSVAADADDIPAATKLGVAVVHAPGSNSQSVAEHALMLMLMSAKRARQVDRWTREGDWSARQGGNSELKGKTLGIVGIGNIGRLVAKFASALGMRVLAYDPYVTDDEIRKRGAEPVKSLQALLPRVDVLTTHTPLTDETRGMINDKTLGLMKRGAICAASARTCSPTPMSGHGWESGRIPSWRSTDAIRVKSAQTSAAASSPA